MPLRQLTAVEVRDRVPTLVFADADGTSREETLTLWGVEDPRRAEARGCLAATAVEVSASIAGSTVRPGSPRSGFPGECLGNVR